MHDGHLTTAESAPMTRTAIIAVHGVGSPPQFETARAVADLLTRYGSCTNGVSYPSFAEQFIKIPTAPVAVPPELGGEATDKPPAHKPEEGEEPIAASDIGERLLRILPKDRDRTTFRDGDPISFMDLDVAFMRDQLIGYQAGSTRAPYNTIEIAGERTHVANGTAIKDEVRIFEMYWADLSRVGTGFVRLLGAAYQLILHVAHLGRKSLDLAAEAAHLRSRAPDDKVLWKRVALWHAWALRFFTIAVPVFSLLLIGCALLFVPDAVAPRHRLVIAVVILELGLLVAIGVRTYLRDRAKGAAGHLVVWILVLAVIGIATVVFSERIGGESLGVAMLNVASVALVLITYLAIINRYDRAAPSALSWGMVGLLLVLAGTGAFGASFLRSGREGAGEGLRLVAFAGFQVSYVLLIAAWMLVWVCAAAAGVMIWRLKGALRNAHICPNETRQRASRTLWTAKVTLAISLFGLLVSALVGYESISVLAWRVHGAPHKDTTVAIKTASASTIGEPTGFNIFPLLPPGAEVPRISRRLARTEPCHRSNGPYDAAACSSQFFDALIAQSGTAGLPIALGFAGLSLLLVSWFIVLIAVTSVRVPQDNSTYARNVGHWITDGFRYVRLAGNVLVWGLVLALTYGLADSGWKLWTDTGLWRITTAQTQTVLGWLSLGVITSAATLGALRARLDLVASRARPAMGILLDVDNYLRESPVNGTPRARMAERFASLLSHVLDRKLPDGQPCFDRIVIVSHSQGTVISADFLRFLTIGNVRQPNLAHVDVRLITMGSPLRQLYSVHFPNLYDWIDRTDDYGDGSHLDDDSACESRRIEGLPLVDVPPGTAPVLNQRSPSPRWLRVRQWVNLFTAGDYVGRPLWQNDDTPDVWKRDPFDKAVVGVGRRERCLGDGTHTRYWTSLDVAEEIDAQIA